MPKELVEKEIANISLEIDSAISELSKKFDVSEQAMIYRLSNLGYGIG